MEKVKKKSEISTHKYINQDQIGLKENWKTGSKSAYLMVSV